MSSIHRDFTLEPSDTERLANLAGPFDGHLRQIELRLGVEIANRGNVFRVSGPEEAVASAERLLRTVEDARVDPKRLRIEITEGALLDDAPRALRILNTLRSHGVLAQLDDFGTGFSALSYMHRFPIQALKIDQSFIAGLSGESHAESLALVRAILALAGTLGIDTIGEGVETEQQRQLLTDLGCAYGQGFLFGPPVPAPGPSGAGKPQAKVSARSS